MTTTSPASMPPAEDRRDRVLLGLEDAGGAGVHAHLRGHRGLLDDRAVGREVAAQHAQAALGVVGVVERADDAAVGVAARASAISPIVWPVTVSASRVDEAALGELAHDRGDAAGRVEVLHVEVARRARCARGSACARETAAQSSSVMSAPASCAIAVRCSTVLLSCRRTPCRASSRCVIACGVHDLARGDALARAAP